MTQSLQTDQFANDVASGDLRNVVKTIAQVPDGYTMPIEVTINDNDLDVVARNAIILLIALVSDNADEAVDCIIHVWYSALIRKSDLDMLQQKVRPLIESACEKIKDKDMNSLAGEDMEIRKGLAEACATKIILGSPLGLREYSRRPNGRPSELYPHGRDPCQIQEGLSGSTSDFSVSFSPSCEAAVPARWTPFAIRSSAP
jgi:hypothetical protein